MQFHRACVEASGNSAMPAIYDRLRDRHLSIIGSAGRISSDPQQVITEHRALLEHASPGDWTAFAADLDFHQSRSHGLQGGVVSRGAGASAGDPGMAAGAPGKR